MKQSGDYYVTVVEDVTLGQIVATATLIIEHKFIHSCAKVCGHINAYENNRCFHTVSSLLFIDLEKSLSNRNFF
jgi:hypothetical protein